MQENRKYEGNNSANGPNEAVQNEGTTSSKVGISLRSVIIAILVLIPIAMMYPWAEYYGKVPRLDLLSVPNPTGLFVVIVLMVINVFLGLFKLEKYRFRPSELLLIYSLIYVGGITLMNFSAVVFKPAAIGYFQYLMPNYKVQPFIDGSSDLFFIKSREAIESFFIGQSSVDWSVWIVPIIMWSIYFIIFIFVSICLVSLVRMRWSEIERLQYPLVTPVLELTEPDKDGAPFGSFWFNKVAQVGMLIALVYHGLNGLNHYFPMIPAIPGILINLRQLTGFAGFDFYPALNFGLSNPLMIGIGFLMPLQLLFSSWFFFVLWRIFLVFYVGAYGYAAPVTEGHNLHTAFSRIALAIALIQPFLRDIKNIILRVFGRKVTIPDSSDEPMSYTVAIFGSIIGMVLLVVLAAGFLESGVGWAIFYFIMLMSSILVLARFRAELGVPFERHLSNEIHRSIFYHLPSWAYKGNQFFSGLVYHPFELGWVGNIPAIALEQYQMADKTNMKKRHINLSIFIVLICVIAMSWYFNLNALHEEAALMTAGGDSGGYGLSIGRIDWIMTKAEGFKEPHYGAFALIAGVFGFGVTYFLTFMNARFAWWPFHPAGYVLATYLPMAWGAWSHLFVAWVIKALIMRYGGNAVYKKTVPFFLGLIAGSVIMQSFWGFVGIIVGR